MWLEGCGGDAHSQQRLRAAAAFRGLGPLEHECFHKADRGVCVLSPFTLSQVVKTRAPAACMEARKYCEIPQMRVGFFFINDAVQMPGWTQT